MVWSRPRRTRRLRREEMGDPQHCRAVEVLAVPAALRAGTLQKYSNFTASALAVNSFFSPGLRSTLISSSTIEKVCNITPKVCSEDVTFVFAGVVTSWGSTLRCASVCMPFRISSRPRTQTRRFGSRRTR